jgi:pyruvate/2-oxoglutarate dehydrogenase complex dihydrolipoamide dehydrogenase (E3) component
MPDDENYDVLVIGSGEAGKYLAYSDEILGFTAFGAEASELMAAVQVALLARMPYTTLRTAIFTHPTAAEGLVTLLSGTPASPSR